MNLDYQTSFIQDSWDVNMPGAKPGHSTKFGWWFSDVIDEILPSPKVRYSGMQTSTSTSV
jgi:hypothetical protein